MSPGSDGKDEVSSKKELKSGDEDSREVSRKNRRHEKKSDDRRSRSKRRSRRDDRESSSSEDESPSPERKSKKHKKSKSSKHKKKSSRKDKSKKRKKRRKYESSSESDSGSDSDDSSSSGSSSDSGTRKSKVVNQKLMLKLQARGETLEERKARRLQRREAKIAAKFGYTAEENPFNDPNLHETFAWTKKAQKATETAKDDVDTLDQIENIRQRREDRFRERDELDRLRAEENRMKELEHYDVWARKEEAFHLQQQRQRSAIRLVEGRQKPIDALAKNLLLFGLAGKAQEDEARVKYKERNNPLTDLQDLQAELEPPSKIVKQLKLAELKELLSDIEAFRTLEREAGGASVDESALRYWDALYMVVQNEIRLLQNGGNESSYGKKMAEIGSLFQGQSKSALIKMQGEVEARLQKMVSQNSHQSGVDFDRKYWTSVREQLVIYLADVELSEIHSKMLVRQLERLEHKRDEMKKTKDASDTAAKEDEAEEAGNDKKATPANVSIDFGNLEEEMGLTDEINPTEGKIYPWQDRYRPRKPRYFNRVRTGYDWNKYNQTHYDHDNPPPKIVQGYKFNIFYPELVDPTKTPQYFLEPADSDEFCIIRFHAGPPYEDIAFKIINREWNRSRKRGFRSSFERGILSLYVNFKSHWYRR